MAKANITGNNIKAFRVALGLTQEQLAVKVNLTRGGIASFEEGRAQPKALLAQKFTNLFGITLNELFEKDMTRKAATIALHPNPAKAAKLNQILSEDQQVFITGLLRMKPAELEALLRKEIGLDNIKVIAEVIFLKNQITTLEAIVNDREKRKG